MNLWDDLLNQFDSQPSSDQGPVQIQTQTHVMHPMQHSPPNIPNQIPIPAIFSQYSFPPVAQKMAPAPITPSSSTASQDLEQAELVATETDSWSPPPFMRPRVCTWGSTISETEFSGPSSSSELPVTPHEAPPHHGGTSLSKRRFTCPDSMRKPANPPSRLQRGSRNNSASSLKRQCPKLSDVESDVSDSGRISPVTGDSVAYSSKVGNVELSVLRQPESHHRARYQKEGSRGCIKDKTGNSCPAIHLKGFTGPSVVVQAYIGTESGPIRAHPLYRVCKVGGKHSTPCRERILDVATFALEMDMTRENNYILNVDCLGIMKLRNADFEQLSDAEDLAKRRKRSPKVRLVFRVILKMSNGATETLQIVSTPICCTPSPGVPEIHFISHVSCAASGGVDIVVIGRNFVKDDSKLFIVEKNEDDEIVWEREVVLLQENFNQVHLVGSVPAYKDLLITKPVELSLYVRNKGGKQSEPSAFKYTPDESIMRHLSSKSASSSAASVQSNQTSSDTNDKNNNNNNNMITSKSVTLSESPIDQMVEVKQQPMSASYSHNLDISALQNSLGSQNLQYCIQLPGSMQPIIITIPQVTSPGLHNNYSLSSNEFDQSHYYGSSGSPGSQDPITVDLSQMPLGDPMLASANTPMTGASQPMDTSGNTDEELFNELLREILGSPESSDPLAAELAMLGDCLPAQHSQNQYASSSDAAAQAASSLGQMDINRQMQNVCDFFMEGQDDGMDGLRA